MPTTCDRETDHSIT